MTAKRSATRAACFTLGALGAGAGAGIVGVGAAPAAAYTCYEPLGRMDATTG